MRRMKRRKKAMQKDLVREERSLTYNEKVKEFVKANNSIFLDRLAILCSKTSQISYEEMLSLLGSDFPMALPYGTVDIRIQIILFWEAVGIPFKADETHISFP